MEAPFVVDASAQIMTHRRRCRAANADLASGPAPWLHRRVPDPDAVTGDAARRREQPPAEPPVPFRTAVRVWFLISLQPFGGPAGQIAVMQRTLVDDKRWIGQRRFLHAMNFCMLLPGPEAQQLATYVGW